MRYCPTCDAEYREARILCTDDGTPLLGRKAWEAALERQGRSPKPLLKFATMTVLDSLFEAEELAHRLRDEGIEATVASTKPAILASLTSPTHEAFALVVPETEQERAYVFVTAWRADLEATTDEASKAADDEERATEPH
jgi:hypothetical protein